MAIEKKEVKLKYPIQVPKEGGGTVTVSSITIGRLKAKHLKALPEAFQGGVDPKDFKMKPSEMIPLIAAVADLPESCVDELDLEDLMEVSMELGDFLSASLSIGEK